MRKLDAFATVLIILGAIAWGVVGLFTIDIFDAFLQNSFWDRFIYLLIGSAGLFKIIYFWTGRWKTHFEEED
jgi:uncharacterized membrane protein YuzA (DUF378 family)